MGKSKGHVGVLWSYEYFRGPDGTLYRAPLANPLDVQGYRQGARFEAVASQADRLFAYWQQQAGKGS